MYEISNFDVSSFSFTNIIRISGAFDEMPNTAIVYVGSVEDQTKILSLRSNERPSSWTTDNVIVKSS